VTGLTLGSTSTALSKLLIVSTLLSLTTSRITIDVVDPPRPTPLLPVEVTPTSAKFLRPAG
jgi:hypothetical protein